MPIGKNKNKAQSQFSWRGRRHRVAHTHHNTRVQGTFLFVSAISHSMQKWFSVWIAGSAPCESSGYLILCFYTRKQLKRLDSTKKAPISGVLIKRGLHSIKCPQTAHFSSISGPFKCSRSFPDRFFLLFPKWITSYVITILAYFPFPGTIPMSYFHIWQFQWRDI